MDALTCRIAIVAIKKKRYVLDLCKSILKECSVLDLDTSVDSFARFQNSVIEDMSIIINRLEVLPDGRADIFMIDGTKHKLIVGTASSKKIKWFSAEQRKNDDGEFLCKYCGNAVPQAKGRKQKLFCSDECRQSWHRLNHDKKGTRKAYCKHCGKEFLYYKGDRKYCSHECYVEERFFKNNNKQQKT